jgi:putative membrane protein
MIHTDARFSTAIEQAVGDIESRTDAEVVVVAAPWSGSYRDLAWAVGGAAGVTALAFLCWSPIVFDARYFPVDVAAIAGLLGAGATRAPRLLVRLAGSARARRQVREAALAAFAEENVHATTGRTGVLVYVSAAEGRVEILPDQGLLGRIPGARWNATQVPADTMEGLLAGLGRLGALLAEHVPATGENPDEIPNAPRVRP